MTGNNKNLHHIQREILKRLALSRGLKFSDLLIEEYASEHVNYHLQKIVDQGLINKNADLYILTAMGKDFVGNLEDNFKSVEKQPKVSVLLRIVRINSKTGEQEQLVTRRLKNPYFGKIGRLGGKVRFGETLEQAARRELKEETGLEAGELRLIHVYHKLRNDENGEVIHDVIFFNFECSKVSGELISRTEVQENLWISRTDFESNIKLDFFDDFHFDQPVAAQAVTFEETLELHQGF